MIRFSDILFAVAALLLVAAPWTVLDGRLVIYGIGVATLVAAACCRFILKD